MKEYSNTDIVPKTGEYLCTSCGEITEFEVDDDFTVCENCEDDTAAWTPAVVDESDGDEEEVEDEFGE